MLCRDWRLALEHEPLNPPALPVLGGEDVAGGVDGQAAELPEMAWYRPPTPNVVRNSRGSRQ
jgi:hypothetical protein